MHGSGDSKSKIWLQKELAVDGCKSLETTFEKDLIYKSC